MAQAELCRPDHPRIWTCISLHRLRGARCHHSVSENVFATFHHQGARTGRPTRADRAGVSRLAERAGHHR